MHQDSALPETEPTLAARTARGLALSPCAAFRRWTERASAAAIDDALSDRHLNPFLFQIDSED